MVDLSRLSAPELAAQLARPSGEIGLAVGDYMTSLNGRLITAAYKRLSPLPRCRVLEIGFGNGKLIGELLAIEPDLRYVGVEISDTMMAVAREHNQAQVQQGRVGFLLATVERLPFPNAAFDRALAVNAIYFWPDQLAALRELRRVLRPGGWLVLASMTPETSARSPTARPEHGFNIPDLERLLSLHYQAGFQRVDSELYEEEAKRLDGTTFQRAYHIVRACL
ncbi:MAG TPA: class I SAM-dependent methyltransferase [Alphaproteobacteria bacterium]|nr:class I SAM-dependent methyltransferase [Alphaproteobacteria bacterium]